MYIFFYYVFDNSQKTVECYFQIEDFPDKGRGIVATKSFDRGDFVVEYAGDLLDIPAAVAQEAEYAKNPEIGSYMYFFKCAEKQHWSVCFVYFFKYL